MKSNIKNSFNITIPIMASYLFLGSAFGVLVQVNGLSIWVAIFMSIFIYSGAMQFASIPLLLNPISLIQVFVLTLSLSARHLFYGLSMLLPFKNIGKKKPYMIFALTDESYGLILNHQNDENVMFSVELLNQIYWVTGTVIGYLFGQLIPFSIAGIEFSMTALFIIIFLDKWLEGKKEPMVIGLVISTLSLLFFGPDYFIILSMLGIIISLIIRSKL